MFEVQFWGVRGSVSTAGPEHAQVGGHTSCVEVRCGDTLVILDAGTGLRGLGASIAARGGQPDIHLLLSHYHWDHIQGFPFFAPAYVPGTHLQVVGPALFGEGDGSVREALAGQMRRPFFPVGLDALRARLTFRGAVPGDALALGADVRVLTAATCHPGGGLAYRIEHAGRSVVYATDHEHTPAGAGPDPGLLALARGADVLIYDAQYTPEEHAAKRGWGHSTPEAGAALAAAAGVGRLVLFHHDPAHDDHAIAGIEAGARRLFAATEAAREGRPLAVGPAAPDRAAA